MTGFDLVEILGFFLLVSFETCLFVFMIQIVESHKQTICCIMTFFVGQNTWCHWKSTSLNGDGASTFWAHTNTPWKSLHESGLVLEEVTIPLRSCGFFQWFFREILKVVIAKSWKFACLSHGVFPFILLFLFVSPQILPIKSRIE